MHRKGRARLQRKQSWDKAPFVFLNSFELSSNKNKIRIKLSPSQGSFKEEEESKRLKSSMYYAIFIYS